MLFDTFCVVVRAAGFHPSFRIGFSVLDSIDAGPMIVPVLADRSSFA